ncbi:hypothetical protein K457DRAFT_35666 [Linnemannia elongata AG-77]|uniref:Replication protein A OB domain-containing protein n=1 Tax=Linnemannia elongata AG-77 TaxID=1314771 RepID=A0A197JJL9_9FUNG|nr:hypothetical protein K457DRAFT_35666 [Linnemannia elongata AG-77]
MLNPTTLSKRITSTTTTTKQSPFASLIQQHNNSTITNNTNNTHSPRKPTHQSLVLGHRPGQRAIRQDNDNSSDPISSPSPSPSPPPFSQVGLSVEVPDYLPTQFVLDNIQHFKSSDHLTPKRQHQPITSNRATSPPRRTDPHHDVQNTSTPTRQRRSMARTLSDIIPDDVPIQVAMQDIDYYRSTDHYPSSNGYSTPNRTSPPPPPPQHDRVRTIARLNTTTTSATTPSSASSTDSQEQLNKRRSGLFAPFKPLFPPPPPPPVIEAKSPKRKSTPKKSTPKKGTPKKGTPKKRQLQEFSVVDDTDPIEDGDSDGDWQVFWEAGKKEIAEGCVPKRQRVTASPSTTPSRPVPMTIANRPALKPPEPLGPKLLQISREEIQQKDSVVKTTKVVQQPTLVQQPTSVVLPAAVQKPTLVQQPKPVQKTALVQQPAPLADSSTSRSVSSPAEHTIPLNPQVVSFASKLTPIKDLSPNEPHRKYNVMGLVQLISPVQDGVRGFGGKPTSKAGLTISDKGSIHLNITLWGDKGKWVESCRVGDVVFLTDLTAKDYRSKTVASTRWASMMFRMDGTALTKLRGDSVIEGHLADLAKMRETLGHHLLDNDQYIARDPSFYQTLNASLFWQQGALVGVDLPTRSDSDPDANEVMAEDEEAVESGDEPIVKMEPEDDVKITVKFEPEDEMASALKVDPETEVTTKVKIEPGVVDEKMVGNESTSQSEVDFGPTRGDTLRGVVVYYMLNVDRDDSRGWEIGVVHMTKNRLVKVQTSSYTSWIDNLRPQRYMEFYGQWSQEDGVLSISESTREPVVIQEKGPDVPTCAQIFDSVKNVIDSRFMGIASVHGYIDGVTFPEDIMSQFWAKDSVFSIPLLVCSNCNMKMEPLQDDMKRFVCVNCQSDHEKRETSKPKPCYHDFQFWLKDQPTLGGAYHPQADTIRVSCKGDVCQQVFPTIPATEWFESIEKYQECRQTWIEWMQMLSGETGGGGALDKSALNARRRRVRVEVGVGKGRMGRAVRVKYLHPLNG